MTMDLGRGGGGVRSDPRSDGKSQPKKIFPHENFCLHAIVIFLLQIPCSGVSSLSRNFATRLKAKQPVHKPRKAIDLYSCRTYND